MGSFFYTGLTQSDSLMKWQALTFMEEPLRPLEAF